MIAETRHDVYWSDAREAWPCASGSVHLVITSPPYPMIAMWDESFARLRGRDAETSSPEGQADFEAMHRELDRVWARCMDALCDGGFLVINVGDATRTIDKRFRLYPNHARIIQGCTALGLGALPGILWRKPTNAPNKFMGSGMLPGGAYVTLEHEHILIFRKGGKREYATPETKQRRRTSALFWEERNVWFSDVWQDIRGERQTFGEGASRSRSAAFPFEFAYRLVNMFSLQGDTVCDPFVGTGTTSLVAMASARHSLGLEIDPGLRAVIAARFANCEPGLNAYTSRRYEQHVAFTENRSADASRKSCAHYNAGLDVPVMTAQETDLQLPWLDRLEAVDRSLSEDEPADAEIWRACYRGFDESPPIVSGEIGQAQAERQANDRPQNGQAGGDPTPGLKAFAENNDTR